MITIAQLPSDQVAALRADDVQLYLASHGWKRDETASTSKGSVFVFPGLADAEAILPNRRDIADYVERMADIVHVVGAVEQRVPSQVLADLSSPPADVLRLQVIAPDATLGVLPLSDGIRLIEGARDLLLAAACSIRQAAPFFPRQAYKEAIEFLQICQLGQTERGSFITKIMAPVPPIVDKPDTLFPDDDDLLFATEPFARKSTVRVMTALGHIRGAIDTGDYQQILKGVEAGVSANLCEAIAKMQPEGDQAQLRIHMQWSPSRPKVPAGTERTVGFSRTAFEIVREAGRKLREEPAVTRKQIEGLVISLKADPSLFGDLEGTIIMKADLAGAAVRVQVPLSADEYKKACDAHRDRRIVRVSGLLHREPKIYQLRQPQNFTVVER